MNLSRYISCIGLSAIMLWACDPNPLEVNKTSAEIVPPVMKSMSTVEVSQANYDGNGTVTFSWDGADFGYPAAPDYNLYMLREDGTEVAIASNINATSYSIDYKSLYNRLIGESYLGLRKGSSNDVKCFVSATVGTNFTVVKSAPVTVKFNIARVSTGVNMLYVVGEFNGNHPDRDGIEETAPGSKIYRGLVNMMKPGLDETSYNFVEYTYAGTNEGNSYGGTITNNTTANTKGYGNVTVGGEALKTEAKLTYFQVDLNTGKCTYEPIDENKVGISGGNWGWSTPAVLMAYDAESRSWSVTTEYTGGTFRVVMVPTVVQNWNNWNYSFGPKTMNELTLKDGGELKLYHNDIGKPILGGDANYKMEKTGKYVFTIYYESADATWRFKANAAK